MDKLKGFPRCYVVNLAESVNRKEYMEAEFTRLDIHDAKVLSYKRYNSNELQSFNLIGDEEFIRTAFIGTITSHLLTIKWWYENTDEEMCAIFEDDCDFSTIEHWNFNFEDYIKKFGVLWDCLQLCVMHEGYPVMYPRHRNPFDHGLQAYIIKRHYARKIVEYYFKDENTINLRMPYNIRLPHSERIPPSIENVIYGLGITYIHPIFNHNVYKFKTTVHGDDIDKKTVAETSYEYVKNWWENIGSKSTLDQIFDYDYCCPPIHIYHNVIHIDV